MCRTITLFFSLMLAAIYGYSQNPLQNRISVSFSNEPVEEALMKLTELTSSQLAFNPDILPGQNITAEYDNETLAKVLNDLLGSNYQYKVRGMYVIIQPAVKKEEPKSTFQIKGVVMDANTGEKLANATIYEVNRLTATLSSSDGSYDLSSKSYGENAVFMISRENYRDTIITVDKSGNAFLQLFLEPLEKLSEKVKPPTDTTSIFRFLVNKKTERHMRNVRLQETRWFQLSLLPGIGTNGFLGGQVTNNLSLNMIGGYANGLDGVELGGVFNLDRKDARGVQMAGVVNRVGGEMRGAQLAGAVNLNHKSVTGVQMSGAVNIVPEKVAGVQMAGAINFSGDFHGLQMSGAYNHANGALDGAQMSGAINIAKDSKGAQLSGTVNLAGNFKGIQMAGSYNHANDTLTGLQVSGAINYASTLNGVQIGIINIAKRYQKGAMIGLINITKGQILAFEFEHNDVTDYNFSFKSGTKHFYTVLTSGIRQEKDFWSTGMGFGSQFGLGEKLYTGLELTSHSLLPVDQIPSSLPVNLRLNLSLGYSFTKRISIHGGPVLNFLYYNPKAGDDFTITDQFGSNPLFEKSRNDGIQKWWIGYRFAVRI